MENNNLIVRDVELPFFEGFYNSSYDSLSDWALEDELEYYTKECNKDITIDDLEFDFNSFNHDIVEIFTDIIKDNVPSWVEKVENPELDSPKFYNFRTDKIYATVTLKDDWREQIAEFVKTNFDWLEKRIKEDWGSRSGFVSWIHNDIGTFMENVYEAEPRYISIIMQYAMELENEDADMYEWMMYSTIEKFQENNCANEYVILAKNDEETNDNKTATDNV